MKQNGLNHTLYNSCSWAHPDVKGREKQVRGHRTMAGETLLLGVVAVIALVAPDSCFFFSLKLREPLAALLRALQAFG